MFTVAITALGIAAATGKLLYDTHVDTTAKKRARKRYLKNQECSETYQQIYLPCEMCGVEVNEMDWIYNRGFCNTDTCGKDFKKLDQYTKSIGRSRIRERFKEATKRRRLGTSKVSKVS